MDLPDDEETFTLIKSETDEPGEQLDTYIQDASEYIGVTVPSFDHEYLQKITTIKEEVEAEDCSHDEH